MMVKEALNLRKMKEREARTVFNILSEQFREEFDRGGISYRNIDRLIRLNWLLLGLPRRILVPNMAFHVVEREHDKEIVSCLSIAPEQTGDGYFIDSLAIKRGLEGQGLGTAMMKLVIDRYGDEKLSLGVRANNEGALRLYKKSGFTVSSEVPHFYFNNPLKTRELAGDFEARLAVKEDLKKLDRILNEVPNMKDLQKSYKGSFNRNETRFYRFHYQLPSVILLKGEIVGIGRALWSKFSPTAQITASAVLPEAKAAYPGFISYISEQLAHQGINRAYWAGFTHHQPFIEDMKQFLGKPTVTFYQMERKGLDT
ncbi:MAG: GNAT family N-acetyltransferase [Candidatus Odinarchaeota archaeon]